MNQPHPIDAAPNSFTPLLDLHMLALCEGGRERSPEEVHALFRDAGLKPGPVHHSGPQMLVEGVALSGAGVAATGHERVKLDFTNRAQVAAWSPAGTARCCVDVPLALLSIAQ